MKSILIVLITLLSISGLFLFHQKPESITLKSSETIVFQAYQSWKSEFGFNYNGPEETFRFEQFKSNYNFIENHNASGDQLVLKINQFAAMNMQEFAQKALIQKKEKINQKNSNTLSTENIDIDWVQKGAVLPTTDQGNCGSCWAFSAIGGLQGLRYLVDGDLQRLSAQQLVSCIPQSALDPGAKDGCGGSETFYAYTYTHKNGIETWENYPYVSGQEGFVPACYHQKKDSVFYNKGEQNGYVRIDRGDVQAIKKQIQIQPMSISLAAGNIYFAFYHKGTILDNKKCGTNIDHAILLTGIHDIQGETPYWTVQNSWGNRWGTNGFGKIGITDGDGICGINMKVVYPTSVDQKTQ